MEDIFGRAVDDEVGQRQAEEDLQIFGSRPIPGDADELEEMSSRDTPKTDFKCGDLDSGAVKDLLPGKLRHEETVYAASHGTPDVTAMDWNSGATPIESWLNQSAVPCAGMSTSLEEEQAPQHQETAKREKEELPFFRRIHIANPFAPRIARPELMNLDWQDKLEFGAHIYYRNIIDKFPVIPQYLACRLAKANMNRAQRLQYLKILAELLAVVKAGRAPMAARPVLTNDDSESKDSDVLRNSNPIDSPTRIEAIEASNQLPFSDNPSAFWIGRSSKVRPASIRSRHSSMNSTLRGDSQFDPSEQNPVFTSSHRGSDTSGRIETLPSLPPPPAKLGELDSFECDICGQTVKVHRRFQWQYEFHIYPIAFQSTDLASRKHVLADLKPYLCTSPDCDDAEMTYGSRLAFVLHELKSHRKERLVYRCMHHTCDRIFSTRVDARLHCYSHSTSWDTPQYDCFSKPPASSDCPFCEERVEGAERMLMYHLCQHMDEIAFAVLTKPYKEWDFYSESQSSEAISEAP
jgi:hypothetical protein